MRERMNTYFAAGYTVAFCILIATSGVAGADDPSTETVSVVAYNVQFLPGLAASQNKRPNPEYRARRIAEEMSRFDIVGLQETFHDRHRPILMDALREHWDGELNAVVSPQPEGRMANGGCLLATRLPIVAQDAMVFENYSKPEDYGFRADGYAAKGVIFGRIALGPDGGAPYVDVFVTHLEARADYLRPLQYKEMADFIRAKHDPANPMLLLGDLNTRGMEEYRDDPESQYSVMMKTLNEGRPDSPLIDLWPHLHPDALGGTSEQESADIGRRIDYILFANPVGAPRLEPRSVAVNLYQDPDVVALSDHNAVEAEFIVQTEIER